MSFPGLALLFIIPVITFIMRWTNQYHFLFYMDPSVINSAMGPLLSFSPGPFYILHMAYLVLVLFISTVFLILYIVRSSIIYRNQALLMISAVLIQWIALLFYLAGIGPDGFDINPFLFTFSSIFYAVGIYRFSLFDIIPVARSIVFEEMQDAVIVVDPGLRLVDYNKRCLELFNNIIRNGIGKEINQVFKSYPVLINAFQSQCPPEDDFEYSNDSAIYHFKLSLQHLYGKRNKMSGSILTFHDITDQKRYQSELENLASIDSLTEIFNRRQLIILSEMEVKRACRNDTDLSLIMMDIDHFKTVNDTYGHQCGDYVLKVFAGLVKDNIREVDIFGRYGGEEFIVLMPGIDHITAEMIAERIRSLTEKMIINWAEAEVKITISIGISRIKKDGTSSIDSLIHDADRELYTAKKNGRNRISIS